MGDLFGQWVPDEWISDVIWHCYMANWHTYQFLTKNPFRYLDYQFRNSHWLGTTIDHEDNYFYRSEPFWDRSLRNNIKFVSFEPLLSPMPLDSVFDWVIIGEETNAPYNPEVEVWAKAIIDQARELGTPVFVKNRLYEKFPIHEFPKLKVGDENGLPR